MAINNSSKFFHFPNTVLKADAGLSPWDIIVTLTTGTNYNYQLIPSTVNNVIPSNYLTLGTGNTTAEKYIHLDVTTTNGRVTGVTISSAATPAESPNVLQSLPPSSFKIALGVIGTNGVFYKFLLGKPVNVSPVVSFESDRVAPIPGLSPRVQWWTWVVSQP